MLSYFQGDFNELWAYDEAKFYEAARNELEASSKLNSKENEISEDKKEK